MGFRATPKILRISNKRKNTNVLDITILNFYTLRAMKTLHGAGETLPKSNLVHFLAPTLGSSRGLATLFWPLYTYTQKYAYKYILKITYLCFCMGVQAHMHAGTRVKSPRSGITSGCEAPNRGAGN